MRRSLVQGLAGFFALWAMGAAWNYAAFDLDAARWKRWTPELVTLPRPEVLRVLSMGYRDVIGDYYWVQAIHYLGEPKNGKDNYGGLANYIDLVNGLSPDFKYAYIFGGMAVPWNRGDKWVNIEGAVRILERGIARFPNDTFMRELLAYNYATYEGRYRDAGDQLSAAARVPRAPAWFASLATRMYATAGDMDAAQNLAQEMISSSQDPNVRAMMERRRRELQTLSNERHLNEAVVVFKQANGRLPGSLDELVSKGVIAAVPNEPLGGHFDYDPTTGMVKSTTLKDRLQLYNKKN